MKTIRPVYVQLLAAILGAVAVGCGADDTPSTDDNTPSVLTTDEKVLLALDYYEPMYKVDADGRVITLRLTGKHLPPAALAEVGQLTELEKLDLYGATVTDEGLAQLKDLQKLRNFGLGGTPITDKGLVYLEKLQGLRHIWLPKERITKAGIEKLKEACPDLSVH
jgi:hypothetical protein